MPSALCCGPFLPEAAGGCALCRLPLQLLFRLLGPDWLAFVFAIACAFALVPAHCLFVLASAFASLFAESCHSAHLPLHASLPGADKVLHILQYSKFIKNGWTILDTTSDVWTLAAMCQTDDSSTEIAVVTTNTESSGTTTNWQFGSLSQETFVEVYRTSTSENCTQLTDAVLPTSGVLQYGLLSNSITTFHFTMVTAAAAATAG